MKASILIVEDEPIVVMDIRDTLERNGFKVAGHTDRGEDTVKKAGELHPDLILMDIGLKGKIDGIEAATQIRAQFDLPVIFLTAYSNPTIIDRARLAEPFAYIIKPFEERELVSNIEMALYKHGMERKLRESENKFRSVIAQSTDGILLADDQGNLIEWNPSAEHISGLQRSDIIGQPLGEVIFRMLPKEQRNQALHDAITTRWSTVARNKYSSGLDQMTEIEIETPQGVRRIIQSNGFAIASTQGTLAGAIIRDITQRKQQEDERLNLLHVLEASINEIYIFDLQTLKFRYVNEGARRNLGYSQEALINLSPFDIKPEFTEASFRKMLKPLLLHEKDKLVFQTVHRRADGSLYPVEVHLQLVEQEGSALFLAIINDITERKRVEEALREANLVVENSPVVLFRWKATEGWPVDMVSQNIRQWGYTPEELLSGKVPFASMVYPDDLDRVAREVQEYGASGTDHFQQEYRILTKNGRVRWVDDRTVVERNPDGQIDFYQGVVIDITARKQTEEALRESEERLRLSLQAANQGLYDLNIQTGTAIVNREYAQMLGYDPESFVETNTAWIERLHPDDRVITTKAYTDYINGLTPEYRVEFRQKMRDGNWKWILSLGKVVEYSAEGKPQRMLGTHTDITERKQAEAELRKLSQAVEQSANVIVITDIAGNIEYANPKFSGNSGYSLDEVLGQNPRILRSGEHSSEFYKNLWDTIKSGRVWRGEMHNRRKDGRLYWEDTTITPVYDAAHNLVNFIAIKEDITARKILEEAERDQRQLAEALRDTSAALTSTLNLDDVLDRVLDNIGKLVTYDAAMVLLIEGHSVRKIRHRHHVAYGASNQPRLGNTQANLINVPILQAIRETREPCLIPDTQADERWRAVPGMGWVRSFISAPVEIRGRVAGLINILSEKPGFFTSFHSERLMAFASQAAVAIENAQLFEQAYHLSITDPLTELSNRRYFFDVAKFEFERTHRYKRTLSIMMVDIDHFKNINDIHGHAVGDLALREIATRIKNSVRAVDIVARYGGEEFIILMPETELNEACQVAERVRRSVADNPIEEDIATINATLSIGVAEIDELSKNMDQLIIYADQALYAAKAAGRNRVTGYEKAGNVHVEAES